MKRQFNKSPLADFWYSFYVSHLPNRNDNLNQLILKSVFILSTILLIIFFCFIAVHFTNINSEESIFLENRQAFEQLSAGEGNNCEKALKYFKKQNQDLKGWISIENSSVASPIYQTDNNEYYLTHNQLKEKSSFGALFFDYKDSITENTTDQNFVIYGNSPDSDFLFSSLKNYKSVYYYKKNPYIKLSTMQGTDTYVIFSVFIINANPEDDGNYIFDYKKSNFLNENFFVNWIDEINQRNLYKNVISTTAEDKFLTLVTDSVEFEGAKLVVMARKLHTGETIDVSRIQLNKSPRYPSIYYQQKGIKNPYDIEEAYYVS